MGEFNDIQWITHDPVNEDSHSIHKGIGIRLENMPVQPIGINRENN
ncbi:MAG: hypothetical protein WD267_03225 [Balneolales bacterium]